MAAAPACTFYILLALAWAAYFFCLLIFQGKDLGGFWSGQFPLVVLALWPMALVALSNCDLSQPGSRRRRDLKCVECEE